MSEYRDGDDAARYRARVLEEELAKREEESAAQKAELNRQRAELAAKDTELAELRAKVRRPIPALDGTQVCAQCGRQNAAHYKFCLGCGADLATAVAAPPQRLDSQETPEPTPRGSTGRVVGFFVFAFVMLALAAGIGLANAR